jgi:hypothetical protein
MKATENGKLKQIRNCWVSIPGTIGTIYMHALPDISDSKGAVYNEETAIGRSTPIKAYSHSEARQINMTLHFYASDEFEAYDNFTYLAAIASAVYPSKGNPYAPPPVCKIKCGRLLAPGVAGDGILCVILKNYSIKIPTDVAWIGEELLPTKIDIDTSWEVVYSSDNLPGHERILDEGK